MKAIWMPRAELELYRIGDYIARDDPTVAIEWMDRLVARADVVAKMPRSGRVVPEFGRDDIREVFERTYRIVYKITKNAILIVCIFEGSMQMPDFDPDEL